MLKLIQNLIELMIFVLFKTDKLIYCTMKLLGKYKSIESNQGTFNWDNVMGMRP